jgi:hypothetical protein
MISYDILLNDFVTTIPTELNGMIMLILTIILIVMIATIFISIHACLLSNRTKQAGQTVKHAFLSLFKQTRKQARQTATAVAQSPLLWQFTLSSFDDPFTKFKSLTDDSSLRPSISPSKPLLWQFTLYFFGCSSSPFKFKSLTDDCSLSPSIISQFQTEADLQHPLLSTTEATDDPTTPSSTAAATAAEATDDPTSPSSPTEASVDLPLRSTATVVNRLTATVADLPLRSTATVAGPPR